MQNKTLAIVIPTYNRAEILEENLSLMREEILRYSIPIYISDDSTNDRTRKLVNSWNKTYEYIYYYKNNPSLGHDKNCIATLSLAAQDHVWLLGDSMIIHSGGIGKILEILAYAPYDFVSVNAQERDFYLEDRVFDDCNELLVTLSWHLTLTGATIYSRKKLESIHMLNLSNCRNFPQVCVIFNTMEEGSQLYWLGTPVISSNKSKKSYWNNNVLSVFLKDYDDVINNLPAKYTLQNKTAAIKRHASMTGLFSLSRFASYRMNGFFSFSQAWRYSMQLKRIAGGMKFFVIFFIALLPRFVLRAIYKIRQSAIETN